MPAVKIAIDIRRMTEFGVGTYIRNVVRTLGRLDHENEFLLIGSPAKVEEIGPLPPNFQTIPLLSPERSIHGYREFRNALKRLDCDLVHIPNPFSVPRALPCPYVMTVHHRWEGQTCALPICSIHGYREFRNALKRLDCDLVHIPNPFSVPRALPCPYVMTVHDMLEHMSRAREQSAFWRSLYFQMTKRVLAGAARIF